jgi:hypothetical protein
MILWLNDTVPHCFVCQQDAYGAGWPMPLDGTKKSFGDVQWREQW